MSDPQPSPIEQVLRQFQAEILSFQQQLAFLRGHMNRDMVPTIKLDDDDDAGIVVLSLEQDGGGDGNASSQPTYTYTATDLSTDEEFGTNLSPLWARTIGSFDAANFGLGFLDEDGEPVLLICDEVENVIVCEPEGITLESFLSFT